MAGRSHRKLLAELETRGFQPVERRTGLGDGATHERSVGRVLADAQYVIEMALGAVVDPEFALTTCVRGGHLTAG